MNVNIEFRMYYLNTEIGIATALTSYIPKEKDFLQFKNFKGKVQKIKKIDKPLNNTTYEIDIVYQEHSSNLLNSKEVHKPYLFYPVNVIYTAEIQGIKIPKELEKWLNDFKKSFNSNGLSVPSNIIDGIPF